MRGRILDGRFREGKFERGVLVPRIPLVHVVRAEKVSGLSRHQVQRRVVQVGKVRSEPL